MSVYSGTLTGFPLPTYTVGFMAGTVPLIQETSLTDPNIIYIASLDQLITGTFNYSTSIYEFTFAGSNLVGTSVYALFMPETTEVVRPNPDAGCLSYGYIQRPEDELQTPVEDMADEYPWRRDLVGGGELVDYDTYSPATPDVKTVSLGQTVSVSDQSGAQHDVQVVVPGPYPPRFVTQERSLTDYVPGQTAIAFTGTFLNLAGPRPTSGTLAGGLDGVLEPGWELYHFGLVQGVLVADAPKFYGAHHRDGLALWYPFNEQSLDAIQVLDHSLYDGQAFVSGISPDDRAFDPVRGNFLAAKPGMRISSPAYRGFQQRFAGGFWLRTPDGSSSSQVIFQNGPLQITLATSTSQVLFQLDQASSPGTYSTVITASIGSGWIYIAWSFDGNTTLTAHVWDSSGSVTSQTVAAGFVVNLGAAYVLSVTCSSPYDIQDLRLWNIEKTVTELSLARYHNPTPTACLYRPAWLQSVNTFDHYAVRVLPSGYLVPDQLPTSIITNQQAWVQRYDYTGQYDAQSRYKETGVGSGNPLPPKQYLGSQWDTLTADGTVVVSSWDGNFPGINDPWIFDNPIGYVLTLIESGSTVTGITGTLLPTGTSSPFPNPLISTNPCRDRIWVKGDDGFVWQVTISADEGGVSTLHTEKLFSATGSYQPTGPHTELTNVVYGKRLAVNTSGTLYSGTYAGTVSTSQVYLYSNKDTAVDLSDSGAVAAWVQPNTFGLNQSPPVAALTKNGQIAFEITDTLQPGYYELTVTSGNIGKVDSTFSGFNVVITVGDVAFQGKLCAGNTGADFEAVNTFTFYLPHVLPGSPSSWLLSFDWSNALRDPQRGTARQLFIRSVNLTRFYSRLYQLNVAATVTKIAFPTTSADYPITPGGWLARMTSWGTAYDYVHESKAYSANDTVQNVSPLSNKLTATTAYRTQDLILNGSFTLPDPALPAFSTYGTISGSCSP